MESTKCQRVFLLLTLWVAAVIVVLFSSWQGHTGIVIQHAEDAKGTASQEDNGTNMPSLNSIKIPSKNERKVARKGLSATSHLNNDEQDAKVLNSSSSYRRRFLLWDKANSTLSSMIGPQRVDKPQKYLIYRCDMEGMRFCGGWADRVKGVLLTYVVANLTGRVFKVEMLKPPCDLLRYLTPNLVNWSLPVSFHRQIGKHGSRAISKVDNVRFLADIHQINFTQMIEEEGAKYTYFKANLDYSSGLQKSKLYSESLSWMANLSNDQFLSTLYKRIFKLSGYLQQRMDDFMQEALPTERHRLICAQVRMGANPTIPNDSVVRFHEANLALVWKFLAKHSRTDEDKIFFMSDSENATRIAKSQPFGHRILDSGGSINHIDKSRSLDTEERCAGLEKVIFDQHVLMQCDVLLISLSGVSRMAAYVRGTHEGLYCLLRKAKIVPCKPENIKKLYRIMG
ncbi:hypothetical protein ElyMa_006307300 [Elysia marginata]|uniref:GT23 domain-containing protein n=1 Tax=Elysia marginata TaxID=1093978 RepID=A0AAV4HEY6_9GAST|nr:hypothetical protein ElyMa_006307300 [Elysia marginata]